MDDTSNLPATQHYPSQKSIDTKRGLKRAKRSSQLTLNQLNILTALKEMPPGSSKRDVARKAGVTVSILEKCLRNQTFLSELMINAKDLLSITLVNRVQKLAEKAEQGSYQHMKLAHEVEGLVKSNGLVIQQNNITNLSMQRADYEAGRTRDMLNLNGIQDAETVD